MVPKKLGAAYSNKKQQLLYHTIHALEGVTLYGDTYTGGGEAEIHKNAWEGEIIC